MSGMSKSRYYSVLKKTLSTYNIKLEDYKQNPSKYFQLNASFRNYVYGKFVFNQEFTWFGNKLKWSNILDEDIIAKFSNENNDWYSSSSSTDIPDKRQKLDETGEDLEELPSTSENKEVKTNSNKRTNPEKIEDTAVDSKKSKPTSILKQTQQKNTAEAANTIQQIPGGTSEVQQGQTGEKQIQTPSGTAQNQRGTLQGESGNIKIQKPLERYGIVKVNMSYNSKVNFLIIFAYEDASIMNSLMELMDETYANGIIYATKTEVNSINYMLVGWHLNFNIGYIKLFEKLGSRFTKVLSYKKPFNKAQYETDEDVHKFMTASFRVRKENNTQLYTIAENVEQENQKKQTFIKNDDSQFSRKRKLPLFD